MLAEAFVRAGHHAGDRLIPPSPANPNGFFEDLDVNAANDDLIATLHSLRAMAAVVESNALFDASVEHCAAMWSATYRSILEWSDASTIFLDVRALRDGTALPRLRDATGTELNVDHVSSRLHRQVRTSSECRVERGVLDGVRDRLAMHDFNHRLPVLGRNE